MSDSTKKVTQNTDGFQPKTGNRGHQPLQKGHIVVDLSTIQDNPPTGGSGVVTSSNTTSNSNNSGGSNSVETNNSNSQE